MSLTYFISEIRLLYNSFSSSKDQYLIEESLEKDTKI